MRALPFVMRIHGLVVATGLIALARLCPSQDQSAPSDTPLTDDLAAALAFSPSDWKLALAAALGEARVGALSRADAALSQVALPTGDVEAAAQVLRTRDRLRALIDVRQRLLSLYADGRKILDLEFAGQRVRGRVEQLSATRVKVRVGKDLIDLDLDRIAPQKLETAARVQRVLKPGSLDHVFLQLLSNGDVSKARSKLTADDAATQALASDLAAYVELVPLAEPGRLLQQLTMGARGREGLAALERLLADHGQLHAVVVRRDPLRQRARVLLASTFDPTTAEGLGVRAIVERGEAGRVRLRYHAKDPAHLLDFAPDAEYAKEWEFKDIEATGPPRIAIEKGQFVLTGDGAFRLPVLVASPFRAEWRLSCPDRGTFLLTFCDDAQGSSIRVVPHGEIGVADSAVQEWQAASSLINLADQEYTVELRHDGKSVTTTVDGVAAARTAKIGSRTRGGVALHVKTTQPCYLASLVIETTIDAKLRETLKQRFAAQRVAQIFDD